MNKKSGFAWQTRDFATQLTQSEALIESKGQHVFIERFTESSSNQKQGVLNGALVSIKDLFDVKGYQTKAGSKFLATQEPAKEDAEAVKKLRDAGAYLLGHTNMTELAYSGLGVNPHYGTPETPLYKGCIAGGSTSGGAASVALGIADIALGSDTGGSLRIPAAFCGVTGFKPSQQSVSSLRSLPLSKSLDSVGPIANNVADCEVAWQVLSGETDSLPMAQKAHFVVPTNFGLNDLDDSVKQAFFALVEKLKQTPDITVEEKELDFLEDYKNLPIWQFSAFEAKQYYQQHYNLALEDLDPRVASRLLRADGIDSKIFADTCKQRQALIERYQKEENGAVLLLPTVAILPPKLTDLEKDADYDRINLLCLRNTSLTNVLNGCSFSLPFEYQSDHIGIMLTAPNGEDKALIALAKRVEEVIAS